MKPLTLEETRLKEEMKHECFWDNIHYKNPEAEKTFNLICHLEGFEIQYWELLEENKQLKDNQVRAMNKIRDFINNANCEIKESKYSNDNHGLYWELFKKDLTNIQKLIKGINTDEYVNIPKYREKELLNLEDNWNKLRKYISSEWYCFDNESVEFEVAKDILNKMQELEQGSDNNE